MIKRRQLYVGAIVCISAHRPKRQVSDHLSQESLPSFTLILSVSPTLVWTFHHAQGEGILSKDEAKLVCKLSLSEIKTQLKPLLGSLECSVQICRHQSKLGQMCMQIYARLRLLLESAQYNHSLLDDCSLTFIRFSVNTPIYFLFALFRASSWTILFLLSTVNSAKSKLSLLKGCCL